MLEKMGPTFLLFELSQRRNQQCRAEGTSRSSAAWSLLGIFLFVSVKSSTKEYWEHLAQALNLLLRGLVWVKPAFPWLMMVRV